LIGHTRIYHPQKENSIQFLDIIAFAAPRKAEAWVYGLGFTQVHPGTKPMGRKLRAARPFKDIKISLRHN
jgi:hypothetical protein